jgi:NADPH:quinone reductase-like Zn-dependent oxidoreductase
LKEDFTKIDQRFDFVFDSVGKSTFGKCKEIMKPQGVYISTELGPKAENIWLGVLGKFSKSKRVLFPIPVMNKEIVKYLGKLVAEGHFKPVIDKQYSLSDIVSAYRYTDSGMKTGNLVLNMSL